MGFLGALFDASMGAGFQAKGTPLLQTTDAGQIQNAYNQSNNALAQQQAFLQALAAQNGIANQSNIFNQQQGLADQLNLQAQGGGPNPALAQLANTTGQNAAQQAALMASQRGASQNAGLIARQAAMQGANVNQQAAGQAAVMRAQQQLAAQQALQQQQNQMANLATQQVGQQAQGLNSLNAGAQGFQQNLLNAGQGLNQSNVGMQSNMNASNAEIAKQNAQKQGGILGGVLNGIGMATKLIAAPATGGTSMLFAEGGEVPATGPGSQAGKFLRGAQSYASGGSVGSALKSGGKVPGKASVKGDSLKNDTVNAKLSPGEIVIPRSIAQGENAPEKAKAFVAAILARNGKL